jgi:hypothetical protein
MSPSNRATCFSAVLFIMTVQSTLLGVLKTQYTVEISSDQVIVEYTRDEYCSMLLTPYACNSQVGTAAQEYMLHYPD